MAFIKYLSTGVDHFFLSLRFELNYTQLFVYLLTANCVIMTKYDTYRLVVQTSLSPLNVSGLVFLRIACRTARNVDTERGKNLTSPVDGGTHATQDKTNGVSR